jgi:hypothetical protein
LKQTVSVYPYTSINAYGEYGYGTVASVPCRIEQADEQVISEEGTALFTSAKVLVDGSVSVGIKDKVVLPNGDDGPVQKIDVLAGPDGTPYMKVLYV